MLIQKSDGCDFKLMIDIENEIVEVIGYTVNNVALL